VEGEPNILAYAALALCPVVSIALVALMRAQLAVPIIIFAGALFLPPVVQVHIPHLPPFDKDNLPGLCAMVGCLLFRRKALAGMKPGRGYDLLIFTQVVGILGTVLTNRDALVFGPRVLPALEYFDFVSGMNGILVFWFPLFFLGRALFRTAEDLKTLLAVVFVCGLLYTPFILFEMKMSPQLNLWIYGYHQTNFDQTIRGSGYRPMVFMKHGLNLALFIVMAIISGSVLVKVKRRIRGLPARPLLYYLIAVLLFSRSAGALIYTLVAVPLIFFTRPKAQIRWARVLAILVFSYPVLRAFGLVPIDALGNLATSLFGADRSGSLLFRLREEAKVMARALERVWFGWGGYGRPFTHDPRTGADRYTIDGFWAIQIGSRGAVGYVALFGIIVLPVLRAKKICAQLADRRDQAIVAGLALMAAFWGVDLLPNASLDQYLPFLVGVLAGTSQGLLKTAALKGAAQPVTPEPEWQPARA
jgi:hypothetical protein